jgi:photosystem II stability/assembly factor-like uncharacterized protein
MMATDRTLRVLAGAAHLQTQSGPPIRGGLFRLDADSGRWNTLTAGLPADVEVRAILPHPTSEDVIYVGTQDGPYRSIDGGKRWQRLGFPDRNVAIWSLAIHPTRHNTLFAGAAPVALYRSLDGGDTWHRLNAAKSPAHCERTGFDTRTIRILCDASHPDDVYAGLEVSGVIRSSDGGDTWKDLSATLIEHAKQPHLKSSVGGRHCGDCEGMLDTHALAVSPSAAGSVFLAIRMGLFRSDDRGETWYDTTIGRFSPLTYCRDVIVSSHAPDTMYTCLSPAAVGDTGSLYRSTDLGQHWQRVDHGIKCESTMMAVAENPRDAKQVFAVARLGQVFGTTDGGATWREYRLPKPVHDAYAVAFA